jgi:hypothetical protein
MEDRHNAPSHPDWLAMTSFFLRSKGFQAQRSLRNVWRRTPVLPAGAVADFPHVLAESVSPLHTAVDPRERLLMLGKIQNLRLACARLHARVLADGAVFSLWRQIGPPWRSRGFVRGREVREGCVIPSYGGGLCQLSGALLEVAMALDLDLLEMHRHTLQPADIPRNPRRDATLFWNYVDLRFRSPVPLLMECFLTEANLVVRLRGRERRASSVPMQTGAGGGAWKYESRPQGPLESCFTCGQTECARHVAQAPAPGKTNFLMDEYQPEFGEFLRHNIKDGDQLFLPFVSPSGWTLALTDPYDVLFPLWFRVRRSATLRWAVFRGVTLAKAHYDLAAALAGFCVRRIAYDAEHLYVSQSLLPYLWRSGLLAGRTFDVLAQRLPVLAMERLLDEAVKLYPHSGSLAEFRAPRWFAQAEQEALETARTVFTPHAALAGVFDRSVRLSWQEPPKSAGDHAKKDLLVFIGPTLARKGAYAVREAVKKTGLTLAVAGADLEEPGFWRGLPVIRLSPRTFPWERIHTVVQPALFEYWPRHLLRAHAAGAKLVITPMCGIQEDPESGIHHVPFGDADTLAAILTRLLTTQGDSLCAPRLHCSFSA